MSSESANSMPFLMTIPDIISRLRSIIRDLAFSSSSNTTLDEVPVTVTHICDIISIMLDFSPDMNIDEVKVTGTMIDAIGDQVKLLENNPEKSHEAMVSFTKLLTLVLNLLRERREDRELLEYTSQPQRVKAIWDSFYDAIDKYASQSEDPEDIRDLYDELIVLFILDAQEEGLISEEHDPRQSPKILGIVKELTQGLAKLRDTPI